MFQFTDILKNYLTRDAVRSLAKKIGASDKETEWAIETANALVISFLARKTSVVQNSVALSVVLDRNHDGAIADDITLFVENLSEGKIDTAEGKEIVEESFTDHRSEALELLCSATGLTLNAATMVLITIAPLVVKTIAEEQQKRHWTLKELSGKLGEATKSANNSLSNKLLQMFDKDNNGKISDDIWRAAKGLFKKVA
jgi:Asp-tRNA(Asn)/Glu-tRNA(Gln) amidotransferase B subunit